MRRLVHNISCQPANQLLRQHLIAVVTMMVMMAVVNHHNHLRLRRIRNCEAENKNQSEQNPFHFPSMAHCNGMRRATLTSENLPSIPAYTSSVKPCLKAIGFSLREKDLPYSAVFSDQFSPSLRPTFSQCSSRVRS